MNLCVVLNLRILMSTHHTQTNNLILLMIQIALFSHRRGFLWFSLIYPVVAVAVLTPPRSDGFAAVVVVADGDVVIVVAVRAAT